jgi:hypothetical protein
MGIIRLVWVPIVIVSMASAIPAEAYCFMLPVIVMGPRPLLVCAVAMTLDGHPVQLCLLAIGALAYCLAHGLLAMPSSSTRREHVWTRNAVLVLAAATAAIIILSTAQAIVGYGSSPPRQLLTAAGVIDAFLGISTASYLLNCAKLVTQWEARSEVVVLAWSWAGWLAIAIAAALFDATLRNGKFAAALGLVALVAYFGLAIGQLITEVRFKSAWNYVMRARGPGWAELTESAAKQLHRMVGDAADAPPASSDSATDE